MMAEPAAKKARRGLLPDLETLEAQRSAGKQVTRAVKSGFEEMKKINLELASVKTMEKLDDDLKMLWLMAKYGTTNVLKIMAAMRTVPASLTENQAEKYVCSLVKKNETVGSDNVEFLYKFLSVSCSNGTLDRVVSAVRVEEELLGPPAMECYSCSRSLVSYLTTGVKIYTCAGVQEMEKITLQCKECHLIYTPTQFGNKHRQGFQFYHKEQPVIEVNNKVYFSRNLLEWQCSLA